MTTNHKEGPRDEFFDRYRKHTNTIVRINAEGYMTVTRAVELGHLQPIGSGVYRPTTRNEA